MSSHNYEGFFRQGFEVKPGSIAPGHSLKVLEGQEAGLAAEYETHAHSLYVITEALRLLLQLQSETVGIADVHKDAVEVVLWDGIVVGYARCFDKNGPTPLDASSYLTTEMHIHHQDLVALRNKHHAHDVNNFRQTVVCVEVDELGKPAALAAFHSGYAFNASDLDIVKELVEAAYGRCVELSSSLSVPLWERTRELTTDELSSLRPLELSEQFDVGKARSRPARRALIRKTV